MKVTKVSSTLRLGIRRRKADTKTYARTRSLLLPKAALQYFGLSGAEDPDEIRWTIHQVAWKDHLLRTKVAMRSKDVR